jgi:hypothetical protein
MELHYIAMVRIHQISHSIDGQRLDQHFYRYHNYFQGFKTNFMAVSHDSPPKSLSITNSLSACHLSFVG